MTDKTPEQRRDETIAAIEAAGGEVPSYSALADSEAPDVIVAYRLDVVARTHEVWEKVSKVEGRTIRDGEKLVPWFPPETEGPATDA